MFSEKPSLEPELVADIAKRMSDNLVGQPDDEAEELRIVDNRPWTGTTNIRRKIIAGGYLPQIAGPDFDRLEKACAAMVRGEIRGLVIWGDPGRGKTCAANAVAAGLLTRSFPGSSEFSPPSLVPPVRVDCHAVGSLSQEQRDQVMLARGGNFWLEDLGMDQPVSVYGAKIDIVRSCIAAISDKPSLKCLITTNLDPMKIKLRYDERTISRLYDGFGWLQLTGEDRRARKIVTF